MQRTLFLLLGMSFFSFHSLSAQYSNLDQSISRMMQAADVPGMSIAVIDGGRVVYGKSFGLRSTDGSAKVNDRTVFDAASLSKPVFAFAVMQLVEEGKFNLDKPLSDYLDYEDLAHDDRYQQITARMVLSHTSGLPNWRRGQLNFRYDPAQQFGYSGEGFVLLQKVIERITGQDVELLMQQRVFKPLGMSRSSYVWQKDFETDMAVPHNELGVTQAKRKPEQANVAYSLQTTAPDYARFVIALMNGIGMQKPTIELMLTEEVKVPTHQNPDELSTSIGWGLGWGLQQNELGKSFWHWGDNGTFRCFVMAYPEQKKALVFFTNSINGLSFVEELTEEVFGANCPAAKWIDYPNYQQPSFRLFGEIVEKGLDAAMVPYMALNGQHQNTSVISEGQMNSLGYKLLRAKYLDEARRVFLMNMRAFPNSSNTYDSYAEACLRSGQFELAKENYRRAYQMDSDNQTARSIVDQLTGRAKGNAFFKLEGYSNARHVALAGDFNGWNDLTHPFRRKDGTWSCAAQLDPGPHEYKFVVDGVWIPDPNNELVTTDKNHNSIVEVAGEVAGQQRNATPRRTPAERTKPSATTGEGPRISGTRRPALPKTASAAQQIIDRHTAAIGGMGAWKKLEAYEISMAEIGSPGNITLKLYMKKPDKFRIDLNNSSNKLMKIWDGERGVVSINYRNQRMSEGEQKEMAEEVDFYQELMLANEREHLVEILGEEELGGQNVVKLKLIKSEGDEQVYYLSTDTWLPVMIEEYSQDENFKGVLFRTKLADYRMVDGLAFPHRMQLLANDRPMWTREVTRVKINPKMEDKVFEIK